MKRVVIVGGGISGLAAAFFLQEKDPAAEIVLLEADRLGGMIRTERSREAIFEAGPDSFLEQKPETAELAAALGLESSLIYSRPEQTAAGVFWKNRVYPLPAAEFFRPPVDLSRLQRCGLFSAEEVDRIGREPEIPASCAEDESVASFVCRRFGGAVLERVVDPLVRGVYGGLPEVLSIRSTFPALFRLEQKRGHVGTGEGTACESSGHDRLDSRARFCSFRDGMASLVEALEERLNRTASIQCPARVQTIRREGDGYRLLLNTGTAISVRAVIIATPAGEAAELLREISPARSRVLASIPYSAALIAGLLFDERDCPAAAGAGFLVPGTEETTVMACSWVHRKFPGRSTEGTILVRVIAGSEAFRRLVGESDQTVLKLVRADLLRMAGIEAEPLRQRVFRWPTALPQYTLGHYRKIQALSGNQLECPKVFLIGNYLDGVGISDCVRHARRVVRSL